MNNNFYLILLILFAQLGGIISSNLSKEELALSYAATTEPASLGSLSEYSEELIDYYTVNNSYWSSEWDPGIIISEYDPIIREVSAEKGYDWRLISAIACAESRFDHEIVSGSGAIGLMQIMPVVARQFKVDPKEAYDPYVNVTLGVDLLDYMGQTFRFPANISEKDRLSITLAAYNCGMGHVLDARRLAAKYGENPNSWAVVSKYLRLKGDPEYYEDEVVRCGQFSDNRQTLGFVKKVLRYYDSYCEIAML